jgi:hypothetical protein
MATPTSRLEVALSMLLVLGLPGCANLPSFALSRDLWCDDEAPGVEWEVRVADLGVAIAPDPEMPGALSVQAQRLDDRPMPRASGLVGARSRWQLTPEGDAAEAMWLLTAAEGFVVHRAGIEVRRDYQDGDIVCCDADLVLDVGVDWSVVATRVDAATLPTPLHARRNDLSESAEPRPRQDLFTQCGERLAALDFGPLLPDAGGVELEAWAWVDQDDVVVDRARAEALCGKDDPRLPLEQRLARFATLRLLVVVVTGPTRTTFRLRPDCVWLCGGMKPDGRGQSVHRSRWHARPVAPPATTTTEPRDLVAGTMRLHMASGWYPDYTVPNFIANVLGTPFTFVGDLLLWMAGLDGKPDTRAPRPRRDWR